MGNVTGIIPTAAPVEAKTIAMNRKQVQLLVSDFVSKQPQTVAAVTAWRAQLNAKDLPKWASQVAEEDLRAGAWKAWLAAATQARQELRDTTNDYYVGAPGFSTASKFGTSWKDTLTAYGTFFSTISPSFAAEWKKYNAKNEMTNAILGWYL